jgi:hypothetical protein
MESEGVGAAQTARWIVVDPPPGAVVILSSSGHFTTLPIRRDPVTGIPDVCGMG